MSVRLKAETHPPAIFSFFSLQTFSSYNFPASVISPLACLNLVFIFIYSCISLVSSSPINRMSTFSKHGLKLHHISSTFSTEQRPRTRKYYFKYKVGKNFTMSQKSRC